MVKKRHEEPKLFEVYMVECQVNGKRYIGKSVYSAKHRKKFHKNNKSESIVLAKAIRKYGWDKFVITVLYQGTSDREICMVERAMIAQYGTLFPNGYNMTIGGDGHAGYRMSQEQKDAISRMNKGRKRPDVATYKKGVPLSEETRKKLSVAHTGKVLTESHKAKVALASSLRTHSAETCQKISESASSWQRGRTLSEQHRKNIGASHTGSKRSEETKKKMRASRANNTNLNKPIWCLETGAFYPSTNAADRALGWNIGTSRQVVDKPNRTARGLHFVSHVS